PLGSILFYVAHHADHFCPLLSLIERNSLADWILLSPVVTRQGLIDQDHFGSGLFVIRIIERSPAEESNAQRLEVIRGGAAHGRDRRHFSFPQRAPLDYKTPIEHAAT